MTGTDTAAPEPPDGLIQLGRYRFAPFRQELHLDNELRTLSHRETQLLEILATRPNEVVQRKDILLQVWDNDSFFNSHNLDVYITRLRDYLKEDTAVQILTLEGSGISDGVQLTREKCLFFTSNGRLNAHRFV